MSEIMTSKPEISVIIPVVERTDDLRSLIVDYHRGVKELGRSAEFIFVVDDRERDSIPALKELQEQSTIPSSIVVLGGSFGESTSLMVGVKHSVGQIIVTLPSYAQVEVDRLPESIRMVEEQGIDLVVGVRDRKLDSMFNRVQSRLFHVLIRMLGGRAFQDISCGFRVMRATLPQALNIYGGLHRFIPILAHTHGFRVKEIAVTQRTEDTRTRYYGLALYLKRVVDVLAVFFLTNFTQRPLRLFGPLGLILLVAGGLVTAYLGAYRILQLGPIADRPLLVLGVLLMVLGIQLLSIGMVGEIVVFTHSKQAEIYRVEEVIAGSAPSADTRADSGSR